MIITATQTNTRQAPRKVRLVANAVKAMKLEDAVVQLGVIERKSSLVVLKVVRQAIANAVHNHGFTFDQLTLKNILITEGPRYKRFQAVSRGRAHSIIKRTCHVTVQLEVAAESKGAVVSTPASDKKEEVSTKKSKATVASTTVAPVKNTTKGYVSNKTTSVKKSTNLVKK